MHLFGFNDFHGNLEPPVGSGGKLAGYDSGGAAYFATHLKRLAQKYPNSATLMAGDAVGASPLDSGLFYDEPSIKFYNQLCVSASSVGNHEFDKGIGELARKQTGGCPADGCDPGNLGEGAKYQYLAANVTDAAGKQPPALKPWIMLDLAGRKVGVIGVVTKSTPSIELADNIKGYTFGDEADAVNKYVPDVKKAGAQAIVVLVHEGGSQTVPKGSDADYNKCDNIDKITDGLAARMDSAVNVIISGHSHMPYVCKLHDKLITQASFYGKLITDITLTFNGDKVTSAEAVNRMVTRSVPEDPDAKKLVDFFKQAAGPKVNRVVGSIGGDITKTPLAGGDTALGDLIADSMLAATKDTAKGGAVAAFMNPGGVRADLTAKAGAGVQKQDGQVTYGELYTVQPFNNQVTTLDLTGQQILALLEQQWKNDLGPKVLDIAGITYAFKDAGEAGSKIVADSVKIGDQPLDAAKTYRVATNNFLAGGGDGFTTFTQAKNPSPGPIDVDVFEAYFKAAGSSPVAPLTTGRVTKQ
ncbi:bifunctional metallophosphatase/5'-nucleotidase [Solihabitans fulvus]|uniref:Bifunctional metallophosphatase/5'-nucleotidase n=1 Tax=Solihabitans fulvus TaxID=1892852 RepID=A0A5B2XTH3_9PSEU|nr:bifunctional metallophosphatase/5'-nucleotidase [Solihabitans fulvus]